MHTKTGFLVALAVLGAAATPSLAQSRRARQEEKNLMRNVGIGLGVVATHELLQGRTDRALVLGAGAAYAGKKYEDTRKAQRDECDDRRRPVVWRPEPAWRRDDRPRWDNVRWRRDHDRGPRWRRDCD